jgi:FMN phosphatase YigB (HAD superfamily)
LSLTTFINLDAKSHLKETNDITHVAEYLEEHTLFVFDLDNTLIETAQHLGSDQWFSYQLESHLAQGLSIEETLEQILPKLSYVYNKTDLRLVDPCIPDLLKRMKQKHVHMIGLTKRDPKFAKRTIEQLESVHIDFSQTAHFKESFVFDELKGSLYQNGVIFIAENGDKGPHMEAFLKRLSKMPKKIVMIDDKLSHVESVSRAVEKLNIPFVGIRYGAADERVKNFDPEVADLQWNFLHKIISDEEALHLMELKR